MQQAAPLSLLWVKPVYRLALPVILFIFYFLANTSAQPALPKLPAFKSVSVTISQAAPAIQPSFFRPPNPLLPNDPYREQNYQAMKQAGMDIPGQYSNRQQREMEELKKIQQEEAKDRYRLVYNSFQGKFQQLLQFNPDSFSITKAVYLTESAYDPTMPSFSVFEASIKQYAEQVRQVLKSEGLSQENNTAVMYGIQKLYTQQNAYYDSSTKLYHKVQPLRYDFNDFMGDKDWTNMFVDKILRTKTGQCHSLPLLFLCVAEQLNAKAYLSLSPNHSFIQYFDDKGRRYNFETTNGNLVTQNWLMQSTYVNPTALKNKTYLDTLSSRQLYAQCLGDFLMGYLRMMGNYDNVATQITGKILSLDSTNIIALMCLANWHGYNFRRAWNDTGNPSEQDFNKYPGLNAKYQLVKKYEQKIEQLGFQEMPCDAYQRWLKSVNQEKQKQQNRLEQERIQAEIRKLKNIKHNFINKPKQ